MPAGRPLKFKSVKEVEEKIEAYFKDCRINAEPYTITGLAIALDTTRETLLDYQNKDEYSDTIKTAKLKCQNYAEKHLYTGKNVVGAIFNLKNNYGWRDQKEIDHTTAGEAISFTNEVPRAKEEVSDGSSK